MSARICAIDQLSPAVRAQAEPLLARWIHEAGNPFADWYFGDPAVAAEITVEWMHRPDSEVHIGRALLLMDDGQPLPVGCVLGLGGRALAAARVADFAAFCAELGSGPEADAVLDDVVPAGRALFAPVPDDAYYLSRVAIDPQRRGAGLGHALVGQVLDWARERGWRRVRLDVSADRAAAIRVYLAAGFRIVATGHSAAAGIAYHAMLRED